MKNVIHLSVLIILLGITGCKVPPRLGEMNFPEGSVQHVVRAENIQWKPCPPNLPEGCKIAVFEGDPKSSDLFTVRFQVDEGFFMAPHSHPKDERVTVLKGKVSVAFGTEGTRESAKQFGPGDYYVNARGAIHSVWADSNSIIQITGIGPWEAEFLEK
ncbi:cupin domain-containing protein [Christiangramia crocea]|uniref:Cupin domain-containing protein n=1 Tax=Christiangramia crocea TaxID=2904124 RepID=A0A9X1UZV6_9FLAO|nr:cupin domain-containing protein [Gramella crocea]MCG9973388.1 cupin domain-containing protein [Gramella crocea]